MVKTEDFTTPLDQPSVDTLQMVWQEKGDPRSLSILRRVGVSDGTIQKQIVVRPGVQPYHHNHYNDRDFFRHDPARGTVTNPYGQRVVRVTEDFLVAMLGSLEDQVGQNGAREVMYKCGFQ